MKIPVAQLDTEKIESIFQAWMAVGGLDPEMEAKKILDDIRLVMEGDSIARFSLDDGYRFGSNVGSSKLFFRVRGDHVDIGMEPNNPYARAEAKQEAERVCADFQERLRGIFSA